MRLPPFFRDSPVVHERAADAQDHSRRVDCFWHAITVDGNGRFRGGADVRTTHRTDFGGVRSRVLDVGWLTMQEGEKRAEG